MRTFLIIEHPEGRYHLRPDHWMLRQTDKIRKIIHADTAIEAFRRFEKWKEDYADEADS